MAMPSYEQMITAWKNLQVKYPRFWSIIQAGIDKLEAYEECLCLTPAYILAMCGYLNLLFERY
jgi:hypothetical protein